MASVTVQTRLTPSLATIVDTRAKAAGITRAEVVRLLLEEALTGPALAPATDPLRGQITAALGELLAKADAILKASRNADRYAQAAHATSRLHALMTLPQAQQDAFVAKLAEVLS